MGISATNLNQQAVQLLARQITAAQANKDHGTPLPPDLFDKHEIDEVRSLGIEEYLAGLKKIKQTFDQPEHW